MSVRITCIKKQHGYHEDPHHAIESLGWLNEANGQTGRSTRLEMYDWLKNKGGFAYVRDQYGNQVSVQPHENSWSTQFVQTVADGRRTDNLLYLPECA